MKKIAIIGAGNVGIAAAKAVSKSSGMELCGFVRRKAEQVPEFEKFPVAESISDLPEKPDGAIIAVPSRFAEPIESELLENGIYTADCFDIHEGLLPMKKRLSVSAEKGRASAIIGAGWDPGLDSVIRTLMLSAFPEGRTETSFGPGMSMGHSAAAKNIPGIKDAVSLTFPEGNGRHLRKIYAVPEKDADRNEIERLILSDGYFMNDPCSVEFTEDVTPFIDTAHRVSSERTFEKMKAVFSMEIDNPVLTGNMLAAAMRASFHQKPGAYFMPEIPPADFCFGWEKYL